MAKKINFMPMVTLTAFAAFLTIFILSLCVIRSADRVDACALEAPRSAATALTDDALHSIEAIRIAFADRTWCPPRVALH
jgi:hypothetical protein